MKQFYLSDDEKVAESDAGSDAGAAIPARGAIGGGVGADSIFEKLSAMTGGDQPIFPDSIPTCW